MSRRFRRSTLRWAMFLLAAAVPLAASAPGGADVVILKDGFTLHGKLQKERETDFDPLTGEPFSVAKPLGFNIIDDGPRSVIYSAHSQQVGDVDPTDIRADFVLLTTKFYQGSRHPVPRNAYFTDATEFNEQWRREVTAKFPGGYTRVKQQITKLTPYYARVDSYTHAWTTFFHTRELGPELVQRLLAVHPELKEKDGQVEPEKRMMKFRFYMQAGWYTVANAELDRLLKDAPQEKERVEQARKQLRLLMAEELLTATERARAAGQHRLAQQLLARFPNEEFNEKVALRLARLRGTYETENARFRSAQRFLTALPGKVGGEEGSFLAEAARTILGELNLDNVERLETFVTLAEQAERDAGEGRPVTHAPEQLLAAAVTGWLQGRNYTETKVESARRFWDARRFVLDYQRTNLTVRRRQMAEGYKKAGGSVAYDELAQLIRLLPPPEPGETASSRATAFAALASGLGAGAAELGPAAAGGGLPGAEETMECRTPPVRWHNEGVRYFLRLPPEYHHGRAYPVLLVLHHANTQRPAEEHAEALLKEIAPHAARHGYILAAPVWTNRFSPGYEYSAAEHMTVIATLRDLRRHYQVDSDRVFLTGLGEGATMAFDVGAGHPDLFAGVVPICPNPNWSRLMVEYWRNTQYLPYYVVTGNYVGDAAKNLRHIFQVWMPKGFPALNVIYKGRGYEWFPEELPTIFEWMGLRKRRDAKDLLQLGVDGSGTSGTQFRAGRETETRFYWLSTEAIQPNRLIENQKPPISPAWMQARLPLRNRPVIEVKTLGLNEVTVWFPPGMIDYETPVLIQVNGQLRHRGPVKPDITVLLEDFYERGDRQQLFYAKLDFKVR